MSIRKVVATTAFMLSALPCAVSASQPQQSNGAAVSDNDLDAALYASIPVDPDSSDVDPPGPAPALTGDKDVVPAFKEYAQEVALKRKNQALLKRLNDNCTTKSNPTHVTIYRNADAGASYFKVISIRTPGGERVVPAVCSVDKDGKEPCVKPDSSGSSLGVNDELVDQAGGISEYMCTCHRMLPQGMSIDKGQLAALLSSSGDGEGDQNEGGKLKEKLIDIFHAATGFAQKVSAYAGVVIPFGDGISAFLGDMHDTLGDHVSDRDKQKAAAKDMGRFLTGLLGCSDSKQAPYLKGDVMAGVLGGLLYNLSQDHKIDMGNTSPAAVSQAKALLDSVANFNCMSNPLSQAQGGSFDLLTAMSNNKNLYEGSSLSAAPIGVPNVPAGDTQK